MKRIAVLFILPILLNGTLHAAEEIRFDFETSTEDWGIPDWAWVHEDYIAREVRISSDQASNGRSSIEVICDFPGDKWKAALIEREKGVDLSAYKEISVDVYVPANAPVAFLKARIILTTGVGWYFTEMKQPVLLKSDRWTTIKARLETVETDQSEWKGREERSLYKNIQNVRKIAVRVEYNAAPPSHIGPRYRGSVYIDNIRIK